MAKSKQQKSKETKQQPQPSSPRCPCLDPYRCACGHRPPRPSPGHKWDPEAQAWGGKGHRQKGASGQAASVAQQAVLTKVGKTKIEPWQRLPTQILDEHCKRQKRHSPRYHPASQTNSTSNKLFRYRSVLPDPKDPRKDQVFEPLEGAGNEEQAREESALLALIHLTPTLPHERRLPEPYKTTWLTAIAGLASSNGKSAPKKDSAAVERDDSAAPPVDHAAASIGSNQPQPSSALSSFSSADFSLLSSSSSQAKASMNLVSAQKYTSQAEKRRQIDQQRRERNERIRRHEAVRLANQPPRVFMCAAVRNQIRNLLRGDAVDWSALDDDDEDDGEYNRDSNAPAANDNDDDGVGDARTYVVERLKSEGFAARQIRTAVKNVLVVEKKEGSPAAATETRISEDDWEALYARCLRWLLSHLDDDQLPVGFDARAGMLDVLSFASGGAAARANAPSSSKSLLPPKGTPGSSNTSALSKDDEALAMTFGLLLSDTPWLRQEALERKRAVEDVLWDAIRALAGESSVDTERASSTRDAADENKAQLEDELEALEAIFGSEYSASRRNKQTTVSIQISEFAGKVLEVALDDEVYPNRHPSRVWIRGGWNPDGSGIVCLVELVRFIRSLEPGEPMIFAIHGEVVSCLQSSELPRSLSLYPCVVQTPPDARPITENAVQPPSSGIPERRPVGRTRRPRERSTFWSLPPSETPPATAFPLISKSLQETRKSLPAAAARADFLELLSRASSGGGQVLCVSGSTGCGKSTNLPQFILESAPSTCKIVVTQPRRLAATGVASRVAAERGEASPGVDSVGYVVRGDSALCSRSRLVFCTTGVLLRQLQSEGALNCITHIVVDEVHERHLDTDVVLGLLKKLLPQNPHLSLVLMSATMDADRLAAYWGPNTLRMEIPGRTFPVKDYTLEDVLSLIRYIPPKKGKKPSFSDVACCDDDPISDEPESEDEDEPESEDEDEPDVCEELVSGIPVAELVKRVDEASIQYEILARLVKHLIEVKPSGDDGSILVFLPGAPEIVKAAEAIERQAGALPCYILPLHGGLQPKEQSKVFLPGSLGQTKVVLATNICQTSVTIPDCTIVIDTAKEKQSSYDPANRMPLLVEKFVSKADLKQRRGRAGRVRSGVCYKLVSKATISRLREHGEPEILRCALDQTLLSILYMGVEDGTGKFLETLLDPPTKASVDAAASNLEKIGAVDPRGSDGVLKLTPMGVHLAGIPAPPSVGKMIVMGTILGCRSASIAMAAGMSIDRTPWLRIEDGNRRQTRRESVSTEESKNQMVLKNRAEIFKKVGNSDHALLAMVVSEWEACSGSSSRNQLCGRLGLSVTGMRDISQLAQQLDASLCSIGFGWTDESDRNANSWRLVRACAVAAMSPCQLVKVVRPATKYAETAEGAREKDGVAKELKFFIRTEGAKEERVFVHPSSFNFSIGSYNCPWLVYHKLVRTSKPFLRDVTECTAYALLLFGGCLDVNVLSDDAEVVVAGWAKLSANPAICSLVGSLRERVDDLLARKVSDPTFDVTGSTEMKVIVKLVRGDGHY